MNKILFWGAVGAGAWLVWRWLDNQNLDKARLGEHLAEEQQLHRLGTISESARIFGLDQVPGTREEPSPLMGAIVTPMNGLERYLRTSALY